MADSEKTTGPLEHADYLKLPTAPTPGQTDLSQAKPEAGNGILVSADGGTTPAAVAINVPVFSVANIEKIRFVCKSVIKRDGAGNPEYCTGSIMDTPAAILADKENKFSIKCPKCRAEFSRGMRFHIMSDQVKGVCELVLALSRAHFGVEFIMKG